MFIMERMEDSIEAIVPMLLQHKPSSKTISVGPIAVRLLECVQAIHGCKNVVRDIKTDNFMLARPGTSGKKSDTFEDELAARIRLIDLALASQYTPMYKSDKNASDIVGTPLYASLNVHDGKKPLYRDDLEALGYVIAELLIKINAGDSTKKLPWSYGTSDDDIGNKKRELVEDPGSVFYKLLGDNKTATAISKYLTIVRGYGRKETPDYKELAGILHKLTVPRSTASATAKASAKKPACRTPARPEEGTPVSKTKRGRTSHTIATQTSDNEEGASPAKMRRQQSRAGMDVENDDSSDGVEMDWEPTGSNENDEPEGDKKPRAKARKEPSQRKERILVNERVTRSKKKLSETDIITIDDSEDEEDEYEAKREMQTQTPALKRRGVRIRVVGGPHKGDSFDIEDSGNETVVIGSKPSAKVGTLIALSKDKSIAPTHLRLDLSLKKSMKPAVSVTNKCKDKVYVNSTPVNNTKAFIGNEITIGSTVMKIDQL
jgi:serine/threonine protein kinase